MFVYIFKVYTFVHEICGSYIPCFFFIIVIPKRMGGVKIE